MPRWGPLELVVEALQGNVEEFRELWVAQRDALDVVDDIEAEQLRPSTDVANGRQAAKDAPAGPAGSVAQREPADDELPLLDRVRAVVAGLLRSTPDQLLVDSDGDIGIRAGSAMVFVRVRDNPPLIDVFSPVLTGIEPTEQLYVRLSDLTNRMPIGRLYCTNSTVWASIPVFGRNFQTVHLMLAIQVMTGLADELDDRLLGEFGGKRFFSDDNKPPPGPSEGTGLHL